MEFGAVGHTSVGKVVFQKGSIYIKDTAKIKLLAQHDSNNPIGRATAFSTEGNFIHAAFKLSASDMGTRYLTLASEDLVSGLSVGVDVTASEPKDGYLLVTAAKLQEISLVSSPAFENATVTSVSASENETDQSTQPTESEAVMTTAPEEPTQETAAEPIEAARPRISAPMYTEVRSPIKTKANYLEHHIKAKLGNYDSQTYVRAADAQAQRLQAADDSFSTNPAFSPTQFISQVIDTSVGNRPTIEALGGARALAASGMTVSHPKITTNGSVATTSEGSAPSETGIVSAYVNATVVKLAGLQRYSVEVLERSDPSFYQAMYENMLRSYARASDAAVIAEIVSAGTQSTSQAATIAGLQAYVAQAGPAVYAASGEMPTAFIAGTSVWSALIGANDTTGRSIFNSVTNPMNQPGSTAPNSIRGSMMGLDLYVDTQMVATTIDDCAFIVNPMSIAIYESPTLTLSTNIPTSGEIETALYGYFAVKTLVTGGLQRFNI
jgi:HK97 family phage prohead protease